MNPYYDSGRQTIYCGRAEEIVPALGRFDLLLTDPPYGMGDKLKSGESGREEWPLHMHGHRWDLEAGDIRPLLASAQWTIVWGGNFFQLPTSRGWLIWDKKVREFTSGHAELAWTNMDQPIRAFSYSNAELATEGKFHPTQKPLALIKWCLQQAGGSSLTSVLDPFMGSGTTLVAAKAFGLRAVGIDAEERYCEIAAERLRQSVLEFG